MRVSTIHWESKNVLLLLIIIIANICQPDIVLIALLTITSLTNIKNLRKQTEILSSSTDVENEA